MIRTGGDSLPSDVRLETAGRRGPRVVYLCHEPLPSVHTNTEQIVHTVSAIDAAGGDIYLSFPVLSTTATPATVRDPALLDNAVLWRRIAAYYGVSPSHFDGGARLRPCPAPSWIRGESARVWFALTAPKRLAESTSDVLYTRDPLPLVAALRSGRRVVFETYRVDLSRALRYAAWRAYCYRHPNLLMVVAHSHMAQAALIDAGVRADRILVAHNGFAQAADWLQLESRQSRADRHLPPGPLVVYTGHVAKDKGLDVVLQVAARVPEVTFAIVGHVPASTGHRWAEAAVRSARVDNVLLIARVTPAEVGWYLRAADVLLIPPSARHARSGRTVVPMKLFAYLAAGRPIVAPRLADVEEVLVDGRNARLVRPDDVAAAAAAIRGLLAAPDAARALAVMAAQDARRYTWEARGRAILEAVTRHASAHNAGFRFVPWEECE